MKKVLIFFLLLISVFACNFALNQGIVSPYVQVSAEEGYVNVTALRSLYNSIPSKSEWNQIYVDTTDLGYWYNIAGNILNNPYGYTQEYVDAVHKGLSDAYAALEKHITSFNFGVKSVNIVVTNSVSLKYSYSPLEGVDTIKWTSSNPDIVSVDNNGRITALKYSTTPVTITAKVNGITDKCTVNVTNPLDKVELNSNSLSMFATKTFIIVPKAIGKDGTTNLSETVIYDYESDNEFVCTVSESGVIKALERGGARVYVRAKTGSKQIVSVIVVDVKDVITITGLVPQFTTASGTITKIEGETETLSVKVTPDTATIPVLTWKSSDTSVVKINSSGTVQNISTAKITALKEGTSKLTYSATDGTGIKGTVTIKVLPRATKLTLSPTRKVIPVGGMLNIKSTILPENVGSKVLDWTTTDTNVCSVDRSGRVTAKANGTCNITAKTTDGSNITAVCKIRVASLAKNISLDKTSADIETGDTLTIVPTVTTTVNSTYKDFVKWVSSDTSMATVSSEGKVTAKAPGSVTITATTLDGTELFATCKIKVIARVTAVSVTKSKALSFKESFTLKPTFTPSNATNKKVTFTSSDTSIATVDSNGIVSANSKAGSCVITCKTNDGGFTSKCTVTVSMPTSAIKLSCSTKVLKAGATYKLTATVSPSNATDKTVKWTTSNSKVAKVDETGTVTAVAGGVCTITAQASGGQKAACTINVNQNVESVKFSKSSYTLYVSQKYTLTPVLTPSTATVNSEKWTSSNTSVATVDGQGKVTAKAVGTCTINYKVDGKTTSTTVTVKKKVACKGIELNASDISISSGKTYTLNPIFTPSNTSVKTVKWTSSNSNVAKVSSTGIITAVSTGSCNITCTTTDGSYKAVCHVSVNVPVSGIRFSKDKQSCTIGESKYISYTVLPSNASNKTLVWSSSKPDVAKVNSKGLVTGLKKGTTTITAKTPDGKYTVSCTLTVCIEVTSIKIPKSTIKMEKGDSVVLTYVIYPDNATNKKVTWKVSDKNVISLKDGMVTALKTGKSDVTITTKDGGYSATYKINVIQPVNRVVLQYSSLTLNVGVSRTVSQYVQPNYATNKNVKWSSTDKSIAKVSQAGKITAVKAGTCEIKCSSEDGYATSKIKITVLQPVKSVAFDKSTYKVGKGKTLILEPIIKPSNASNKKIVWSTTDSSVATVDSNGIVKGIKIGSCSVVAKTESGQFTTNCKIIVYEPVKSITLNKTVVNIQTTKKTTIVPTISPSNATYKDVIWSSNSPEVAKVDENGIVTALAPGYAVITAKTKQGGLKATCKINVIQPVKSVKVSSTSLELDVNEIVTLKATVSPKNASNPSVVWSSSNTKVVKVDRATGLVTAVGLGSATITAKTNDGGYCATCSVTVLNKVHEVLMSSSKLTLYIDSTDKLTATVSPSNATNKKLTWYSSDQSICLVSSTGKLTPVKVGKATIYAKSEQGGVIGKCVVTVERKATSIKISTSKSTLDVGEILLLNATINPSSVTNKNITWKSDNVEVATVSKTGEVKALSSGTVHITATVNGDVSDECVIIIV